MANWTNIAAIGLPALAGGIGALSGGKQSAQQLAQQQQQQAFLAQIAAILNQQQTEQGLQSDRTNRAIGGLNAMPLGQEQNFINRQRMMQQFLPALSNMKIAGPTNSAIASRFQQIGNPVAGFATPQLMQGYSDPATQRSLEDYRRSVAMVNPDYEFGDVGAFGLDQAGMSQNLHPFQGGQQSQLRGYEAQQRALAEQQRTLAMQQAQQASSASSAQAQKKGGGFLGTIGGILKAAAPVAALAIPGIGPLASAAIAGGGMAAGNLMQGGGLGSTLLQGGLGAAGAGMARSAMQGNGLNPFNNNRGQQVYNQPAGPGIAQGMAGFEGNDFTIPGMSGITQNSPQAPMNFGQQVYDNPAGPYPMQVTTGRGQPIKPALQTPQYAPQPPVPFMPSHGGPQAPQASSGRLEGVSPELRGQVEQILNNPMFKGYQTGGFGRLGGFTAPPSAAMGSAAGSLPRMLPSGPSPRMLPPGPSPRALPAGQYNLPSSTPQGPYPMPESPLPNALQNMQNIQNAMKNMTPQQAAQFNADPLAQAIMRMLSGVR